MTSIVDKLKAARASAAEQEKGAEEPEEAETDETNDQDKPENPKRGTAPKGVDHDKVVDLHRQGDDMVKIAEKMCCSVQTIRYHLRKEGLAV